MNKTSFDIKRPLTNEIEKAIKNSQWSGSLTIKEANQLSDDVASCVRRWVRDRDEDG